MPIKTSIWSSAAGKAWDFAADFVTKEFYDRFRSVMASHDPSGIISLRHGDFTVTGGGTTTLTLAGMSIVPTTVDQLRGVVSGVGGSISEVWTATTGPRLTWTAGAGGGTLVRTDGSAWPISTMGMTWCVPRLHYAVATDSQKVTEQDPITGHVTAGELVDTTNIGAGPTYYPSSAGQSMAGYKDLVLAMVNSGGVTVTVEITDDDSGTPDWIDITKAGYDEATNTTGNASYVDTTSSVAFDNLNHNYWRVKVVGDGSNAVQIHYRMKGL